MATYLGFSTINACNPKTTNMTSGSAGGPGGIREGISWGNKFGLADAQLVVQDFINALNIRLGTKVGQPGYGTRLWDFIFDPNNTTTRIDIENEVEKTYIEYDEFEPIQLTEEWLLKFNILFGFNHYGSKYEIEYGLDGYDLRLN